MFYLFFFSLGLLRVENRVTRPLSRTEVTRPQVSIILMGASSAGTTTLLNTTTPAEVPELRRGSASIECAKNRTRRSLALVASAGSRMCRRAPQ